MAERRNHHGGGELDWAALGQMMGMAQDGDASAYRHLLMDLAPYLRRLCARRLSRADAIEDVVQDILMSVHVARRTYDPHRPLQPWINAIAARRLADRLRRHYRLWALETPLGEDFDETFGRVETNDGADADIRLAEASGFLRRAIADLPPRQRQAVELLRLQELSLKEASTLSGQSETALKVAMHRALNALRRTLGSKE